MKSVKSRGVSAISIFIFVSAFLLATPNLSMQNLSMQNLSIKGQTVFDDNIYLPLVVNGIDQSTEQQPNPTPTPLPTPYDAGFQNVMDYGAVGDGTTDDTIAIQSAINAGKGIVFFPPGEYAISETLVISGNGVTLQGSGTGWVAYMYGFPPDQDVATSLKWTGEMYGTLLKIGDGTEPNAGCAVKDLLLDGNGLATHLLVADATFYLRVDNLMGIGWRDGFGIIIKHSGNVRGSGEKYHTWTHVTLVQPFQNASGIDIAPDGGNVNQVTIESCNIARSNVDNPDVTSLRLGYADHITFNRCVFMPNQPAYLWQDYERFNPYAITIRPIENHRYFPMNIAFYGTSLYGGINYDNEQAWQSNGYASLLFYPFYTADWQRVPPNGFINGQPATLPYNMVKGFTDLDF